MNADPEAHDTVARNLERYRVHARDPRSLGWRPETQAVRFAAVAAGFPAAPPSSVLDVGCGFGDALDFLRGRGWVGHYIGVDVVPEFIDEARSLHRADADAEWHCADFLENASRWTCDAVFASGLFNHRRRDGNVAFAEAVVAAMVGCAASYVAADFLSTTSDRRRDDLFFWDPGDVLALGLRHTRRVALDHSYMPFEFMLKLWRDDAFSPDLPAFSSG
jgi:SAM-dependent methyltransferase